MNEKIVGYILLSVGLLVIAASTLNVYQVFSKQIEPVQIFSFPSVSLDLGSAISGQLPEDERAPMQAQMGNSAKQEIIPSAVLNDSSNLAAHLFLMGFIVSVGYRVASLGTQLVRTIVVPVRGVKDEKVV